MPSLFKDETEFFSVLARLISQRIKTFSQEDIEQHGLESILRLCVIASIQELMNANLILLNEGLPSTSLARLVEIDISEPTPKLNLWPLVIVLFPLAKLRSPENNDIKLVDSDGDSLFESTNGRFIDLS